MRIVLFLTVAALLTSPATARTPSLRVPKEYAFETLTRPIQEGNGRAGLKTLSLEELEQQTREAVRRRKSTEQPIPLGGLTDILGYHWDAQRQRIELIGASDETPVSPIYAEQFVVALRLAHYPMIIQSLNPAGTELGSPQLVLAYPKEVEDTLFLEPLIQADYFLKAISMNHARPLVRTPKTAMEEAVLRCKHLPQREDLKGPPDNIFFRPGHPVIEQERTADGGFNLWIRDIDLKLHAGKQVKNPDVLTFVDQMNQRLGELIAAYPRVFRPLVNIYKIHIVAQLLMTEQEAKTDLSYWLSEFPVAPHPTPRELPVVKSEMVGRFCEGPAGQYDEHVSSGQLWGGILLNGIHGMALPGRKQTLSGIYRSNKNLLVFRSDGLFEALPKTGTAILGKYSWLKDSSIAINAPEWQDTLLPTQSGLQGKDGVFWVDETRNGNLGKEERLKGTASPESQPTEKRAPDSATDLEGEVRELAAQVAAKPGVPRADETTTADAEPGNAGDDELSAAARLDRQAVRLAKAGAYRDAIRGLEETLRLREKTTGTLTQAYMENLQDLSELYLEVSDFENSSFRASQALQVAHALTGDFHPAYAWSLIGLATALQGMGNYAPAVLHFEQALDILRRQPGSNSRDYAAALAGLASLHRETEDLAHAAALYQEALQIHRALQDEKSPEFAAILSGLGLVDSERAEYPKAEAFLKAALEIRRKTLGPSHPETLQSLNNLAVLYDREGRLEEADRLFRQTLELSKGGNVDIAPWDAVLLNNFAIHLSDRGDYRAAEKAAEQALAVARERYGPKHPTYANLLNTLASTYTSLGQLRKAKNLYLEALKVLEGSRWERHIQLATTLSNLGMILEFEGDSTNARVALERNRLFTRDILGESHPLYARALSLLGESYFRQGNREKAESFYRQALESMRRSGNEESPGYGEILRMNTILRLQRQRPEGIGVVDLVSELGWFQ